MPGRGSVSINAPKRNLPLNAFVVNGAASQSHNNDYSTATGTPEVIKYAPAELVVVTAIQFYVEDTGDFIPGKLGVDVVLGNGIALKVYDTGDNVLHDFLDGQVISVNWDFAKFTPDLQISSNTGLKNVLTAVLNLQVRTKALVLDGGAGEYIGLDLDDDLTDLDEFTIMVLGYHVKSLLA